MDRIRSVLEKYETDLQKAYEGACRKVSLCRDFKKALQRKYQKIYKPLLEEVVRELVEKGHSARIEEQTGENSFFSFSLELVPRHLHRLPADRYYPDSLWSSITFLSNEHTMTVDVEIIIRPVLDESQRLSVAKIAGDEFNENTLLEKVAEFLERAFDETIVVDFRTGR